MTNALLLFATAAIGFGGQPWAAFAIGAALIVLLGIPQQRETLKRYGRQPVTDVVLVMLLDIGLVIGGAFASAWVGYGLRYLLELLLKN
jgi:H+/gluconate symporter-like permease